MKTVTLCGSMRFAAEMKEIALQLELRHGLCVLQCAYNETGNPLSAADLEALEQAHLRKIDLSDGVYIVDPGGYIGESVQREIAYAAASGKEILYHSRFGTSKL